MQESGYRDVSLYQPSVNIEELLLVIIIVFKLITIADKRLIYLPANAKYTQLSRRLVLVLSIYIMPTIQQPRAQLYSRDFSVVTTGITDAEIIVVHGVTLL